MELNEAIPLWKMYNEKLVEAVKINQRLIFLIEAEKVKSNVAPLFWRQIVAVVIQTVWMVLLVAFLAKNFFQPAYALSALVLMAFFIVAFISSIKQLIIIKGMDYSNDIVTIQGSLAMLQANNLNYARMVILFIPAFLAFPVVFLRLMKDFHVRVFENADIITLTGGHWWTAQLITTISLIPLGIWSYKLLSFKNIHKKWVRDFIERSSGRRVRKALEFMKELHALKFEDI